jgi:death-on-curing protein
VENLDYLSVEDLLEIGKSLIPDFRVRDLGLLQSAAIRPKLTVYGSDAYASFPEKVAALMHALAKNHALVDGNKRMAWAGSKIFCIINGKELRLDIDEAEELIVGIASGKYEVAEIVNVLSARIT